MSERRESIPNSHLPPCGNQQIHGPHSYSPGLNHQNMPDIASCPGVPEPYRPTRAEVAEQALALVVEFDGWMVPGLRKSWQDLIPEYEAEWDEFAERFRKIKEAARNAK